MRKAQRNPVLKERDNPEAIYEIIGTPLLDLYLILETQYHPNSLTLLIFKYRTVP